VKFLTDGNTLRATLGIDTHWTLDALISSPPTGDGLRSMPLTWVGPPPAGRLLNYDQWPGPAWFHTADGTPVLSARRNDYANDPNKLAPPSPPCCTRRGRAPLVNILLGHGLVSTYDALADAMAPAVQQGVRSSPRQRSPASRRRNHLVASTTTKRSGRHTSTTSTSTGGTPRRAAPSPSPARRPFTGDGRSSQTNG